MKKYFSVVAFVVAGFFASAQNQDPNSPGFDFNATTDSTSTTDTVEGDQTAESAPVVKPYERIVLAMDSITNMITYTGVVEQEESSSDSIYFRAKKWALKTFTDKEKGEPKGLYEIDKKNQKLIINGSIPAYLYGNKYAKSPNGRYLFKMTILIKEGRYKYTITNLAHEAPKPNQGTPNRNYFEYYYTTTTNIKGVDSILRYADKDINKMIENMKKTLKEKPFVDEDEW